MTRIEREVLHHIEVAAPRCRIHGQVCLGALLQLVRWLPGNARRRSRYGYASKIVDFVVEDRASGEFLALVEPNNRSHDRRAGRTHDRLTARAGYLTIQLSASENPTRANVAARIAAGLRNRRQAVTGGRPGFVQSSGGAKRLGDGPGQGDRHEQLGF